MSNWAEREFAEKWGPLANLDELLERLIHEVMLLRAEQYVLYGRTPPPDLDKLLLDEAYLKAGRGDD